MKAWSRCCNFLMCSLVVGGTMLAQERSGSQDRLLQTLPPVEVEAPRVMPQESPYERAIGGSISWSSDEIRTDSTRVGPYNQPVWTTQRPFATTRTYVIPEGTVEFSQWVRPTWPREGKAETRFLEEIAIGLPCRFQLDIYERWNVEPDANNHENADHEGVQFEVRWALADWSVIPFNPTLYAEWIERDADNANTFELKLLLAEEIGCNWFYAANFVLEQEVGGEHETELAISQALSTPIIERKLLGGLEMLIQSNSVRGDRSDPEIFVGIGPSLQWRPTNRTFVDVVGLFGTTGDSPIAQTYIIFGYQFGNRAGPSEISAPASTRGR